MPGPCDLPGVGAVCEGAQQTVISASSSIIDALAHEFADAATTLLETSTSFWLELEAPAVDSPQGLAAELQERTTLLTFAFAAAGIIAAGIRMALTRRTEPGKQMAWGLARMILASTAGAFIVSTLTAASDIFATWLYASLTDDSDDPSGFSGWPPSPIPHC